MSFPCIRTEGGLIPADILEQIAAGETPGQQPSDFGLPRAARLTDEIAAAWADARAYWDAFQRGLRRLPKDDPATTVTREQWVLPLLRSLGYADVAFMPRAAVVGSSTYAISHRAGADENAPPVHVAGCRADLDRRPPEGRPRLSPHALAQEYLNRTEHLWGIVTNGYRLRLLRDSALMTRPSYVEFDLQQMMTGEQFADFALLYRLAHRSRLPRGVDDADECWLERYHQQALEQGGRVRERLRDGVEEALVVLGCGFLRCAAGDALRRRVRAGDLTPAGYYRQLLRLVYRLLFLMVSEERNLVGPEDARLAQVYRRHYSLARLRDLAEGYFSAADRHGDLWQGLCQTFRLYEERDLARRLGMEALDGDLFGPHAIPDLESAGLFNADLLRAMRHLSIYREGHVARRVNYAALDVEELGSVYESLLEYHPVIEEQDGRLTFAFVLGMERKTTGSYYTRPELVQELIRSALEPVIGERMQSVKREDVKREDVKREDVKREITPHESHITPLEEAILSIKVCDPACGSGHFLLAAARRLGRELARIRTGEEHPPPAEFRRAVRDVIRRCIYGVDKNPLAVDLCKVALWLEGHNRGLPLTFLDHRIKCGDSLVGVLDLDVLRRGVPDEAYQPVSGDDKKVAAALKKRNRQEREGQLDLFEQAAPPDLGRLAELWRRLSAEPDADVDAIRRKAETYEAAHAPGGDWRDLWTACNLWTAAFFSPFPSPPGRGEGGQGGWGEVHVPTTATVRRYLSNPRAAHGQTVGLADALSVEQRFFHWPLEFPDVFAPRETSEVFKTSEVYGGFDVVLCNPPWERIKLQEQEFFAARDLTIARAPNKAARERLIAELPQTNPALWGEFQAAKHAAEALSKFLRAAGRYPLTARGDINTYSVFAELFTGLVNPAGRVGMIVPTGVATDDTNRHFFAHLVDSQRLLQLIGFENEAFIFPAVHHAFKFCALTVGGERVTRVEPDYVFFCRHFHQVKQPARHFSLTREDIARINPNTRTCPIFRTRQDADLTRQIYARAPVLLNEATGENPWGVSFLRMIDMANDSHLFRTREQLEAEGLRLEGNRFVRGEELYLPLYEAKMVWLYDHRFGSYAGRGDERGFVVLPETTEGQHQDPDYVSQPFYWVAAEEVEARLQGWARGWLLGFRDVTSAVVQRTAIFSLLPRVGVGNNTPLLLLDQESSLLAGCLLANFDSLALDWATRQKIAGVHMNFFFVKQLPVLPPTSYSPPTIAFIVPRVLELVYTAWDIQPFADDVWREADAELRAALLRAWEENSLQAKRNFIQRKSDSFERKSNSLEGNFAAPSEDGFPRPPFIWDEERRATLRAELDALYARLYGLTRKQLRYILDPADLTPRELSDILDPWEEVDDPLDPQGYAARAAASDFPGETFRVLKEKERKQYGEYRTRRLTLEAWGRVNGGN